ncbi:MAG: YceI family protein [Chloroflexi bacterium]|nr:YceI family protein [Chloroflexota bacterium]
MKATKTLLGTVPLLLLLGCSNPADNVPAAAVKSATNSAGTASDPGGRYFAFGPDSATIEFIGSKVTGSHHGGFRSFAGEFSVVNGQLADSGNKIVIEMSSIWADNDRLTGHLKSPDFFNVAQLPTATFVSTSVAQKAGDATVTGNLTLHGVTKQISFPARIQAGAEAIDVTAEFVLNRFDFDIKYPGKANDLIRKEVVLKLKVKAAPGRAKFASVEQPQRTTVASAQKAGAPGGSPHGGRSL